jgi:hypothetical protein
MSTDSIHLADLYKHDEIYWVPADRLSAVSSDVVSVVESAEAKAEKLMEVSELVLTPEKNQVVSSVSKESVKTGHSADSFESSPTLDAEANQKPAIPETTWLVVGDLSGAEHARLQMIFSAPPMLLSEQDWAVYVPVGDEPALSEFIAQAKNKKFIFLGQQPALWQSEFPVTEIVQHTDKLIYFFPRLLSTLTDAEKSLKLVFWNAIKEMK